MMTLWLKGKEKSAWHSFDLFHARKSSQYFAIKLNKHQSIEHATSTQCISKIASGATWKNIIQFRDLWDIMIGGKKLLIKMQEGRLRRCCLQLPGKPDFTCAQQRWRVGCVTVPPAISCVSAVFWYCLQTPKWDLSTNLTEYNYTIINQAFKSLYWCPLTLVGLGNERVITVEMNFQYLCKNIHPVR